MDCPKCQLENREAAKFCKKCGLDLELACTVCGSAYDLDSIFCDECGFKFDHEPESEKYKPKSEGERKHVTVLFSDLSGYTAMSEKLDPEELKEIMNRIFGQIRQVIQKYEGFIEKFAGDAVMAIFGVPQAHEDDPIRAIKAAGEIHRLAQQMSPAVEKKIGQPLSMHSGITTGLVVASDVNPEQGTHGVSGDALSLAARLSSQADADEILVGQNTYIRAEGYFNFDAMEPTRLKGKAKPVSIYKVLSERDKPATIRRLSGVRAELVGRQAELAELSDAVENLSEGRGRIFSIVGDAGTGKSRLVEEFKASLDPDQIQWVEGHAYAYAQNIPFFPLIDLLNRIFQIKERDSAEDVKKKLEDGIEKLVGSDSNINPWVGGLYSLDYPDAADVSPEFWKTRLHESIYSILTAAAKKSPTVFFLEDLHWADPSSVDLIRHACLEIRQPAVVVCVFRPPFNMFTSHQISNLGHFYHEMQLEDLSRSESQEMIQSLLKTDQMPSDLRQLVQGKAEGNPFYLEELINSLIESKTLVRDNGSWKITKSISEAEMSSSVHGLIAGRLDRLEKESKRILQEASVIGRTFLFEILQKITELQDSIDGEIDVLERLDLIRARSFQPDLEYMFKHPLTQEIVYNGLLKKERQKIHEQIGLVIEQLFHDRLTELYETLAYHFARCQSTHKAVEYLLKSAEKCLARYTVEEAHQHFKQAFDILTFNDEKSQTEKILLIDLINKWGYAFYYRGEMKEFIDLLNSFKDVAESLNDQGKIGMFYAWFGIALYMAGKSKNSYEYLCRARELGEMAGDTKVVGYACAWLSWVCWELGTFNGGIEAAERAQEIAKSFPSDQYLFFKSLAALTHLNLTIGETGNAFEGAKLLLDYGDKTSNRRYSSMDDNRYTANMRS